MELDFAIVWAIAGMIAIANPTLNPFKPDSSTQTRRAVTSTQTGEFNTAEHTKYKYVRWGGASNQTSSNAVSASVNTASSDPSAKFCICMEYIKNRTGIGDIDRYEPDEYFEKYGYSRISDSTARCDRVHSRPHCLRRSGRSGWHPDNHRLQFWRHR